MIATAAERSGTTTNPAQGSAVELGGWGRYPKHVSQVLSPRDPAAVAAAHKSRTGLVARGNGRAYGDAAIGRAVTLSGLGLGRMRAFEEASGALTVEAGVLLPDILSMFVPRGFFPPVVPGTKFVTVGGMVAADVHGKNHHRDGGFGEHVETLRLAKPDGELVDCSRERNPDLFAATIGGMGLTGTVVDVTLRLKRIETGWMRQQTMVADDLDAALRTLERCSEATYSVAWIDTLARGASLGRSLIYVAEHATLDELRSSSDRADLFPAAKPQRISVPIDLPAWSLNRSSVTAFNAGYFRRGAAAAGKARLIPWDSYFFPLDGVGDWNRVYGRRGFLQHQCVVPSRAARAVVHDIIERLSKAGISSFLAVLKQLGPSRTGMMSFPMSGYTLALDIPASAKAFAALDAIDTIVAQSGGRLYLAKDARQSRETFEAGYPGLAQFKDLRRLLGAEGRIASRLSDRLGV